MKHKILLAIWLAVFIAMIVVTSDPGTRSINLAIFLPIGLVGIFLGELYRARRRKPE